jgi:RNA polymerase sigma factor (sigma-70 family)
VKENLSAHQLRQAAESVVIALACMGSTAAFAEIVRRHQNRVRNFMHRLCHHPDEAEDLAQQAFLKAWTSIRQLRTPAAFHAWLNRIMVSIWLEESRRKKLDMTEWDARTSLQAPEASPGKRIDLDGALAKLSAPMRLCVVLSYNNGLSHQEISDVTNMPLGTVKANISRGAAKLRELLSDYSKLDRGYGHAGWAGT